MLDESICHFRGILSFYSNFDGKTLLANTVDLDQTPYYVASDLGLHCLPITLYGFPGKNGSMVLGMCSLILTKSDVHWQSDQLTLSYWRKYVHEVLVNRLGGLSLPRKSVVRLTDRPDMTLDVYRGRKTTIQQQLTLMQE